MSEHKGQRGHSAFMVNRVYTFRAIEKILPPLRGKSSAQKWGTVLLCLLVFVSIMGVGIYVDGYGIHPPAQYTGICPPPDTVRGDGCYSTVAVTVVVDNVTKIETEQVPAGQVILPNSTK